MKSVNKPHRRLPAAVKFILVILTLAAIAYPFRLPPASQAESNNFYKTDGNNTALVLEEAAGALNCTVVGKNGTINVDAFVEVPEIAQVPVLRVSQGGIDINAVQSAFGLDADTAEIADENIDSYNYKGYDIKFQTIWYGNGTLDVNEAGKIEVYLYDPGKIYSSDEIVDMLHACGLLVGDVQITTSDDNMTLLLRPIYEQLPVSSTFAFDSYTAYPNYGVAFTVEQHSDGTLLTIEGRALGEAQVIWDSANVVLPEDALQALAEYCYCDEIVNRIVLAYHTRTIYGDPFNVVLYPVWEIYTQSAGIFNASIVNAITGQVEQSMLNTGT